jgi:glyoxylase-like metal-dependent hydrolase (beta-lactamase superfamily II)
MIRTVVIVLIGFAVVAMAAITVIGPWPIIFWLEFGGEQSPDLLAGDSVVLGSGERWFDDYYTLTDLDDRTTAIGEPRYWQANYSYLIQGDSHAILFDSGSSVRSIRPVVEALTDRPVTVIASHFHYDHLGAHTEFDDVAMPDMPALRARTVDALFTPTGDQHLGAVEAIPAPTFRVTTWWQEGQLIDLGGRSLMLLFTPGHATSSVMLWDAENQQLFTGDYIYDGPLFVFGPEASASQYLATAERLNNLLTPDARLFTAHGGIRPGPPELVTSDLGDLRDALVDIATGALDGEGWPLTEYPVNERLSIQMGPSILME